MEKRLVGKVSAFRNSIMEMISDVVLDVNQYIQKPRSYSGIADTKWGTSGDIIHTMCYRFPPHNVNRSTRSEEYSVNITIEAIRDNDKPYIHETVWESTDSIGIQGKLAVAMGFAIAHTECSPDGRTCTAQDEYGILMLMLSKEDLAAMTFPVSVGYIQLLKILRNVHKTIRSDEWFQNWVLETRAAVIKNHGMIDDILE